MYTSPSDHTGALALLKLAGEHSPTMHKASSEAENKHSADVALAARFDSLMEAARAADGRSGEAVP